MPTPINIFITYKNHYRMFQIIVQSNLYEPTLKESSNHDNTNMKIYEKYNFISAMTIYHWNLVNFLDKFW